MRDAMRPAEIIAALMRMIEYDRDEVIAECYAAVNRSEASRAEEWRRDLDGRARAVLANRLAGLLGMRPTEVEELMEEAEPSIRQQIIGEVVASYLEDRARYAAEQTAERKIHDTPAGPRATIRIIGDTRRGAR